MYNALILPDVPIDKISNNKLWKLKILLQMRKLHVTPLVGAIFCIEHSLGTFLHETPGFAVNYSVKH
jgi:hypothetical protein